MLSRSFFPNFGQGPFPKIAGKSPVKTAEHYRIIKTSLCFIIFTLPSNNQQEFTFKVTKLLQKKKCENLIFSQKIFEGEFEP